MSKLEMSVVLSAELAPGETKEIEFSQDIHFRPERFVFGEVLRPRWLAILEYLRYIPFFILSQLVGIWDDKGFPRWKMPTYIPVNLVQFKVGGIKQFQNNVPVPAEIFSVNSLSPTFCFNVGQAGVLMAITLQSVAKHPIKCRFMIVGSGLI